MFESLEEAFKEVAQLPEDEQRHIVEIIRQELTSEKRWQTLFHDPRSERVLENLVAEALAEDAAGETEEITSAFAIRKPDYLLWFWIGSHAEYEKMLSRF